MALSDYTPVLAWFADSLTLDAPSSGVTKSNPGSLVDPSIAGTTDKYADFNGTSTGIKFVLPAAAPAPGKTGAITIVMKFRFSRTNSAAEEYLWHMYDGSGASPDNVGLACQWQGFAADLERLSLRVPPRTTSFECRNGSGHFDPDVDAIVCWRRSAGAPGTWTMWTDPDATGGMTSHGPSENSIETSSSGGTGITETSEITIGSSRDGTGPSAFRLYWLLMFQSAITDSDIQLADWTDEAALKSAFGFASIGFLPFMQQPAPVVLAH